MTKLFTAAFLTETADLTMTPISTARDGWEIARNGNYGAEGSKFGDLLMMFRDMAQAKGWEVSEGPCAVGFPPGGRIIRSVYEEIRTMILDDLKKAMPVDVVLLQLHGAALAHGYDDCEGDLLEHIRAITGPDIPIGIELDPHCHISEKMMRHTTAMILYKTFGHTDKDLKARAVELFNIIADTVDEKINPVMALFDCRMIDLWDDGITPEVKALLETVYEGERREGVLSISPVHGYPFADVADMGTKMLVITDGDQRLAYETAEEFGKAYFESRGRMSQWGDITPALDEIEARAARGEKITIVEFADSSGNGSPTDGTEMIQALLKRGMSNVAVAMMWDPLAVSICHDAGVGAELMLRMGGKIAPSSGVPLDLNIVVERLYKSVVIPNWQEEEIPCDAAVVRSGETELLLVSKRVLPTGLNALRALDVEPADKQFLVLKYAGGSCDPDGEGLEGRYPILTYGANLDYKTWDYKRISRPKWPWDEEPFDIT